MTFSGKVATLKARPRQVDQYGSSFPRRECEGGRSACVASALAEVGLVALLAVMLEAQSDRLVHRQVGQFGEPYEPYCG